MIATIVSLLVFAALVVGLALLCAMFDKAEIDWRTERGGADLDHGPMWRGRALAVLVISVVLAFPPCWGPCPFVWSAYFLRLGLLLILGAFLFSLVFRLRLNKLRGKHPCYIAPWSNVYDRAWYSIPMLVLTVFLYAPSRELIEQARKDYSTVPAEAKLIHQAGRLAYITESILSLLAGSGYILTQWAH